MEFYSARRRNELLMRATTWINLKTIMLNERSQAQKRMYCIIEFI